MKTDEIRSIIQEYHAGPLSKLMSAAERGNLKLMRAAIDEGASVHARPKNCVKGWTFRLNSCSMETWYSCGLRFSTSPSFIMRAASPTLVGDPERDGTTGRQNAATSGCSTCWLNAAESRHSA